MNLAYNGFASGVEDQTLNTGSFLVGSRKPVLHQTQFEACLKTSKQFVFFLLGGVPSDKDPTVLVDLTFVLGV